MFPFDDVIMEIFWGSYESCIHDTNIEWNNDEQFNWNLETSW